MLKQELGEYIQRLESSNKELLEACKESLQFLEWTHPTTCMELIEKLEQAINKAEGK